MPNTRKDCPSCGSSWANRSVTAGGRTRMTTQHMTDNPHPGITKKMVAHVLDNWNLRGVRTEANGSQSRIYPGFVPRIKNMVRVVASWDDERIISDFQDRNATKQWHEGNRAYFNRYTDLEERDDESESGL